MSYCRFADDSDVYVVATSKGWWIMAGLEGESTQDITCKTRSECISNLMSLRRRGYRVPERALKRLHEELRSKNRRSRRST